METMRESMNCRNSPPQPADEFLKRLSLAARRDLEAMQCPQHVPANRVLFSEREAARGIVLVFSGEVKMSINSSDGRRLSLGIVRKGEILGLSSTLSGRAYDLTAETLYPASIAPIGRAEFLAFLMRHPEVYLTVIEELSLHVSMARRQLRTVALSATAPEKLARLLLDWSENGQITECGTRFRFPLTHEQIGEFIGASRETVTRTMAAFKHRRLVAFQGSMATIPNRTALASYAGN